MKVVLISPPEKHILMDAGDRPNMGLLYLAGSLRDKGHEAVISDLNHDSYDELKEKIKGCDFIGITTVTPYLDWITNFSMHLKHNYPDIPLIAGGPHATNSQEGLGYFDYIVKGEGEKAIIEIIEGTRDRVISIPYEENLDSLPIPHDQTDYPYTLNQEGHKTAVLLTSRSCPYNCCFCTRGNLGIYRVHSPDRVLLEIKGLIAKGYDSFYFLDDHFTANRGRAIEICNRIIQENLNISFRCTSRTDRVDEELMKYLKEAGLRSISFGLEHFDNQVLKLANKGETVEDHLKAIKICQELGIKIRGSFIVNLPGATEQTIKRTLAKAIELDLDYADFYPLIAYPGTPIYENPTDFGVKINSKKTHQTMLDSNVDTGLRNINKLVKFCRDEWKEHKKSLCPWEHKNE